MVIIHLTIDYLGLFRLKRLEEELSGEEAARGQVTGELRVKRTQHMTTSRWERRGERGGIIR